jgi:hypothetical protein
MKIRRYANAPKKKKKRVLPYENTLKGQTHCAAGTFALSLPSLLPRALRFKKRARRYKRATFVFLSSRRALDLRGKRERE